MAETQDEIRIHDLLALRSVHLPLSVLMRSLPLSPSPLLQNRELNSHRTWNILQNLLNLRALTIGYLGSVDDKGLLAWSSKSQGEKRLEKRWELGGRGGSLLKTNRKWIFCLS